MKAQEMFNRPIVRQMCWMLAAVVLLAAAGAVHRPLAEQGRLYELNPPQATENHPATTLLAVAPGGLRAPLVTYLWIRAESYKNAGRTHEAMQLADLICNLQPNFEGVWAFQAWNMAWNISVTAHTPEQRWLWVYNGVELLRDRGIPLNRDALLLYKELAWIFYNKMGQYLDEMHVVYKQRWASLMHEVLGAPPTGSTSEAIAAFRPIAEAPLDKAPNRQGQETIQADQLEIVLQGAAVAEYAALLGEAGVAIDRSLLRAYNEYSMDPLARLMRVAPPRLDDDRSRQVAAVINNPAHAVARGKLVAFVRAQVLWNVYRLDPSWMLELMERFGPIDWRQPQPHGLYWTTYGIHITQDIDLRQMDTANTDRIILNALQGMTFTGRLTYLENPREPEYPYIRWGADWRFIEPTQQEFIRLSRAVAEAQELPYERNLFRDGHINYLIRGMQMLYAGGHRRQAQQYYEWTKENYHPKDKLWELPLEDFVIAQLNREDSPTSEVARGQIDMALQAAFLELAAGDTEAYRSSFNYAQRVHRVHQQAAHERTELPAFGEMVRDMVQAVLVRPERTGVHISLVDRSAIYRFLEDPLQRMIYPAIAPSLRIQCELEGLDFAKAFPAPPGLQTLPPRQGA